MTARPAIAARDAAIVDLAWRRATAAGRPTAILIATTARGAIGVGEAAPLPGRSPAADTADAAVAVFTALARRLPIALADGGPDLLASITELATAVAPQPSARFAIETAILDAVARERGVAVAALLRPRPAAAVPVNALVADAADAVRAVERGIATVKVKLAAAGLVRPGTDADRARAAGGLARGGTDADRARAAGGLARAGTDADRARAADDVARLAAIRAAVGPAIAIRADVNRGWPTDDALDRLAALASLALDYVEEPCPDAIVIAARSPVPLALDETVAELADAELDRALAAGGLAALVVKPTLIGGLVRALALAGRAAHHGVDVVVTHAFEGPIATAACAELARALAGSRAVGLDAHAGLAGWRSRVTQLDRATVVAAAQPGLGLEPDALRADLAALPP